MSKCSTQRSTIAAARALARRLRQRDPTYDTVLDRRRVMTLISSGLSDRHPHAVADLGAVDRLAELERGGQDLAGDQIAVRLRPLRLVPRHRDRHPDPVRHIETGALANVLQFAV